MRHHLKFTAALSCLSACTSGGSERVNFGSSTIATSADGRLIYATHVDNGLLARFDTQTGAVDHLLVGLEPQRVARVGDAFFVTLRGERAVRVIVDRLFDGMSIDATIDVGAEPYGIVASPDGRSVYVAASMAGYVVEIDVGTRTTVRRFAIPHEPRWLAVHPRGQRLYVGSAFAGYLAEIELRSGVVRALPLPATSRFGLHEVVQLTPRITGDLTVTPDGRVLVAPVVYADDTTVVDDPGMRGRGDGYANDGPGISRFNAALVEIPLERDGEARPNDGVPIAVTVFKGYGSDGRMGQHRSYFSAVAAAHDSHSYYATMEGADLVVSVGRYDFDETKWGGHAGSHHPDFGSTPFDEPDMPHTSPAHGGFVERPTMVVTSGVAPSGIAVTTRDDLWIHSGFGVEVRYANHDFALSTLAEIGRYGDKSLMGQIESVFVGALVPSALAPEIVQGRALFYSSTAPSIVQNGAGVSCATCHNEGRTDGLTWSVGHQLRQTPSLAGPVSQTAPFTWTSQMPTVAELAHYTSTGRMGGHGASPSELAAIEAYIEYIRPVDNPRRDQPDPQVALGQQIFERDDVGCASCHSGPLLTDNDHHALFGLYAVNTPTLIGVVATPPYLHDGSAPTLRDVLELSRVGMMGDTSMLSSSEMDALEAYLASL